MGQGEILAVLEQAKKPLSRAEIARAMDWTPSHVSHSLARLVKAREVKIIELNRQQATEFYKVKHRMRLYYV